MKLRCENLVKKYGPRTVVKGVSMEVQQGEIVGFLGPNGAGKSTFLKILSGALETTNGEIVTAAPETSTKLKMFAPIILPSDSAPCPLASAVIAVTSSGKEVPSATKVSAITVSGTPSSVAM